ncbi:hypothetical protein CSB45_14465 [candidate division KSB3 bacterium]|uniref:Uncharacterized protein n=1 Tax=candidate division KSB3 bacterium TaxID=2044937 RepID=A0A2G6E0Y1_9BACT|nr:MAG: hypothetical protein CSB45_14465 [candidate division KSB3 bacterium]PIE28405.1 MAG: hypothetical protein CSA57_13905 [candidate division KSB3 bacterium]
MNVRDFAIVVNPHDLYYGCKVQIVAVQSDFDGRITDYTADLLKESRENETIMCELMKKCPKLLKDREVKDYPAIDLHYFSSQCWRQKIYSQMQLL